MPAHTNDLDIVIGGIHSGVIPANVSVEDNIVAQIRLKGTSNQEFESAKVWKMSPLGIELLLETQHFNFSKGTTIDLEIIISGQRSQYEGLIVECVDNNPASDMTVLSIRLSNRQSDQKSNKDRRVSDRWLCSDQFLPSCICSTPGRFNDFIYFQIRDISETGVQLACSLRNKFLLAGMKLDLQVSLPLVSNVAFCVNITRINIQSESGKDYLIVGAEYHELNQFSKNALGQYLVQFGNIRSLRQLRAANFIPESLSRGVEFYFLKNEDDYRQVLALRLAANADIGHISPGISVNDMADAHDSRARIVVAKFNDKVIASVRMIFSQVEDKLEQEQYVKWPTKLPRKDQILEISRAVTHKDFRRNDLLATLFGFIAAASVQSDRDWVLMSATDELVSFYKKLGLRETGLVYTHPTFGNTRQNIMLARIHNILCGKGVHPLYWNLVWKEAAQHVIDSNSFSPRGTDKLRMSIYRSLAPLSKLLITRKNIQNTRT